MQDRIFHSKPDISNIGSSMYLLYPVQTFVLHESLDTIKSTFLHCRATTAAAASPNWATRLLPGLTDQGITMDNFYSALPGSEQNSKVTFQPKDRRPFQRVRQRRHQREHHNLSTRKQPKMATKKRHQAERGHKKCFLDISIFKLL